MRRRKKGGGEVVVEDGGEMEKRGEGDIDGVFLHKLRTRLDLPPIEAAADAAIVVFLSHTDI